MLITQTLHPVFTTPHHACDTQGSGMPITQTLHPVFTTPHHACDTQGSGMPITQTLHPIRTSQLLFLAKKTRGLAAMLSLQAEA